MDAFSRIEPVARDLLARVDAALIALGAPADHPIGARLRLLGTTPGDAVAYFASSDPVPLRAAGAELRGEVREYGSTTIPVSIPWHGRAGEAYANQAAALRAHLGSGSDLAPYPESLSGRLAATASYVEDVANWLEGSRADIARALADVLTSAQAVIIRSCPALADGLATLTLLPGRVRGDAIRAAADVGDHVLATAAESLQAGHDLLGRWRPLLTELPFRAPQLAEPARSDAPIHLHH